MDSVVLIADCAVVKADLELHCLHMACVKCCLWQDYKDRRCVMIVFVSGYTVVSGCTIVLSVPDSEVLLIYLIAHNIL